jgi:hypothetical protein
MSEKRPSNYNASITHKRGWKRIIVYIKLDEMWIKTIHKNTFPLIKWKNRVHVMEFHVMDIFSRT